MDKDPMLLANVIMQLQSSDNNTRRAAEATHKQLLLNNPQEFLNSLFSLITEPSTEEFVSHYSSYLVFNTLRAILRDFLTSQHSVWGTMDAPARERVHSELLRTLQYVPSDFQRLRLVESLSVLYELQVRVGAPWAELPALIRRMLEHADADVSKAGAHLMSELSRGCSFVLRSIGGELVQIMSELPSTAPAETAVEVSACAKNLVISLSKQSPQFSSITSLLNLQWIYLQRFIQAGEAEPAAQVIQHLSAVCMYRPRVGREGLLIGYVYSAKIFISEQMPDILRRVSLALFLAITRNFPDAISQHFSDEMVKQLFWVILEWVADPPDEVFRRRDYEDGSDKDVDPSLHGKFGENAADTLSISLGAPFIVPLLREMVPLLVASQNWKQRFAASIVLSVVAQGCASGASNDDIMCFVMWNVSLAADADPRVRWTVCHSLGQCCSDFAPTIQEIAHEQLSGALHALLQDEEPFIAAHAAAALINFYSITTDVCCKYTEQTLSYLVPLMQSDLLVCQKRAVSCLAAIASLTTSFFARHYSSFMPAIMARLEDFLSGKIHEAPTRKPFAGKLLDAISLIGRAVGPALFEAEGVRFISMLNMYNVFEDPESSLRPYLIGAIGRVAGTLSDKLSEAQVAPMMGLLLKIVRQPIQLMQVLDGAAPAEQDGETKLETFDFNGGLRIGLNVALIEEISETFLILETLLDKIPNAVRSYFGAILECCVSRMTVLNTEVKAAAGGCLIALFKAVGRCNAAPEKRLEQLRAMHATTVPALSEMLLEVAENSVAFEVVSEALATFFSVASPEFRDDYVKFLAAPLVESYRVAEVNYTETMDDTEDEFSDGFLNEERESFLSLSRNIATEVIGEGFKAYPRAFWATFRAHLHPLVAYWQRDAMLRSFAVFVVADIFMFSAEAAALDFAALQLPGIFHEIESDKKNYQMMQACFYTFRCVFQRCPRRAVEFAGRFPDEVKRYVEEVVDTPRFREHAAAFESAVTAVGFLLVAFSDEFRGAGTLEEIWRFYLAHLQRFREDNEEISASIVLIVSELRKQNEGLIGPDGAHLPAIARALIHLVANPTMRYYLEPSVVQMGVQTLQEICTRNPAQFADVTRALANPVLVADLEQLLARK
eukprot:gnl/Chilomastix_cuspidata/1609.p1 GENE.gnl/Chilomastix_cuspidata/1609~~gnl/Chilomastix_cuspidata/1609.p1  ORF type:complete len:1121 (-),score=457.32 gnl/Chilomastix_cuspidata/1609:831-4193(-)